MRKQVTLPYTKQPITIDDSMHVNSTEVVYVEHKDGSINVGKYSIVAVANPNLKKVWKIVPTHKEKTKLFLSNVSYRLKIFWYKIAWWFFRTFMKKTLMRQKFQINAGLSDVNDTHFFYARKIGANIGNFFATGLVEMPQPIVKRSKSIKPKK